MFLQFEMQLRCLALSRLHDRWLNPSLSPCLIIISLVSKDLIHTPGKAKQSKAKQKGTSTLTLSPAAITHLHPIPSPPHETNPDSRSKSHALPCALSACGHPHRTATMNTPYFRGSNEENAMATSPLAPPNTIHATPHNRRVLGEVSTNPRVYPSSPATGGLFNKKAMMGSPLKRSFTAAVEDGYGLKYLKKRRMSGEMGFGPVEQRVQRARREDHGVVGRARSVPEPAMVRTCDSL